MKIKSIHLQNFKRFTDLTISELPNTARLVVLVGPNGCGKSSVFDALHAKAKVQHYWGWQTEQLSYWNKTSALDPHYSNPGEKIAIDFHGQQPTDGPSWAQSIYTRSAHRNDPAVNGTQLTAMSPAVDERRFQRMIDNDAAVALNYQRLVSIGCEQAFDLADEETSLGQFREELIGDVREAVGRLFNDPRLDMCRLGNPLSDGTFRFSKGAARQFSYENLSGGEKAAFDLVLDLVIKRQEFSDTVFCIDEPEAHLGLRLQGRLLRELYGLVPDGCQLWIATHSVGMIRAAHDLENENTGTVVFLDFGDRDFDAPQTIRPSAINRASWMNMHEVVLEDLAALTAPDKLVLCEGRPGSDGLDARCYNAIFSENYPDTLFISTGGKGEVGNYAAVVKQIINAQVTVLRDRDNLSERQVNEKRAMGTKVLSRSKIEDYLLDDEVLKVLCKRHCGEDEDRCRGLLSLKREKLAERGGDAKSIVNDVRMWVIRELGVRDAGDNAEAFLRDTVAPLIRSGMQTYSDIERDVFGDPSGKSRS